MMFVGTKLVLLLMSAYVSWAYDPRRVDIPFVNSYHKRHSSSFHSDEEIAAYLPLYEVAMMIWRCRDAIQPYWDGRAIPVVDDGKYTERVTPHYANGRFFNRWLDFTLRIHNATQADSGVYYFRAMAIDGSTERQQIHVDIS
ncbi:hypothetical protein NP493_142g04024 [Ridgeia piscesae]|uniref:Uncharacterized protein n=1 Tax=Ridgeia piscesae TaxID=27915 RepID=A0AAD9P4V0_RIDPI|nr:hypothetical protein NP493_142g04024 [Ridgeia piscesae]